MWLSLSGSDGTAAELPLAASVSAFEAGGCDTFTLMLPYLGLLQSAALFMGPPGARPGWHVAWLHVIAEEPPSSGSWELHGASGRTEETRFVYKCALRSPHPEGWGLANVNVKAGCD